MNSYTKHIVKKQILGMIGMAAGIFLTARSFQDTLASSIPYSYRQSIPDVIDYIAGRNVFNRKDSLQ